MSETENAASGTASRDSDGHPPWLIIGIHLLVLWACAVVQPVLGVVSNDVTFFVARDVSGWAFIVPLIVFMLAPPLVMLLVEWLVNLVSVRARRVLHLLLVGGLAGALALYYVKRSEPNLGNELLLTVPVAGAVFVLLYTRFALVRSFLTALLVAPVLFLGFFLLASPATALIFPDDSETAVAGGTPRDPLVVLIFDELPISSLMQADGKIDAKRYPNFAKLARSADWYRNTITAADQTEEAVPALLSGRRPAKGDVPTLADYPKNLFTILDRRYEVSGMEHLTRLCPPSSCPNTTPAVQRSISVASAMSLVYPHIVLPAALQDRLPAIGRTWGEALASEDPSHTPGPNAESVELSRYGDIQFDRFLESIKRRPANAPPPMHLLHSSLPHVPWLHLPSGKTYDGIQDRLPGLSASLATWSPSRGLTRQGFQRHLLQTMFADRLLGRLMQRLRATGLYDRSVIAVVADHGVSFEPGGERRAVNQRNAGDVGSVPFFLKRPGQRRGTVDDRAIQTIDVLPTILDSLNVKAPGGLDGRPARLLPRRGRTRAVIARHQGGQVTISTRKVRRLRDLTLRRQSTLFGHGRGPRLFAVGGMSRLVGADISRLPPGTYPRLRVQLADAQRLREVDPRSRFVPALIRGRLKEAGPTANVAVAVNGRVAGTGPTYSSAGAVRFSILIPQQALRAGRNRVEVLALPRARGRVVSRVPVP